MYFMSRLCCYCLYVCYVLANHICPVKTRKGVSTYQYHCWDSDGFCVSLEYVGDDFDDCRDGTDEGRTTQKPHINTD